jgi:glycosyltransferase involved in cell wall biosynthesis
MRHAPLRPGAARAWSGPGSALRVALLLYRGNPRCGGQGVYARQLSRELVALGHEVTVFSGQPYPELDPRVTLVRVPSLDLYREGDPFRVPRARELTSLVDLYEVALMRTGAFAEPRTFSLRARAALARRAGAFHVVHDDHGLGPGLLSMLEDGWPVLASIHHPVTIDRDLDLAHAKGAIRRAGLHRWYGFARMQGRVARRLPRILTVSDTARDDIVAHHGVSPTRIAVVPVGVDADVYRPLPGVGRVRGRVMATVSSDVPLKGLLPLLEAIAKLRVERPEVHLVLVGRPRADGPVAGTIERLGLKGVVTFVSGEPDATIARRYGEACCAVVPSLYEGFSLPAIEALACETPLVATTGGALPEVLGEDGAHARLVPPGDPSALALAIGELLDDPIRAARLAKAGRQRVLSRYSWAATAAATVGEYERVLVDWHASAPC